MLTSKKSATHKGKPMQNNLCRPGDWLHLLFAALFLLTCLATGCHSQEITSLEAVLALNSGSNEQTNYNNILYSQVSQFYHQPNCPCPNSPTPTPSHLCLLLHPQCARTSKQAGALQPEWESLPNLLCTRASRHQKILCAVLLAMQIDVQDAFYSASSRARDYYSVFTNNQDSDMINELGTWYQQNPVFFTERYSEETGFQYSIPLVNPGVYYLTL